MAVAVAIGVYLNSPGKEYVNDFSSPAVIVPLLTTRTYPPMTLASLPLMFCLPAFGVSMEVKNDQVTDALALLVHFAFQSALSCGVKGGCWEELGLGLDISGNRIEQSP